MSLSVKSERNESRKFSLKDVSYVGIFMPGHVNGTLQNDTRDQHITLIYKPSLERFKELLPYLGTAVPVDITGYANDGKNEGLSVRIPENIPYYGAEKQHITISVANGEKPVNTGFLDFQNSIPDDVRARLVNEFGNDSQAVGVIAVFTKEKELVYLMEKFEEAPSLADMVLSDVPPALWGKAEDPGLDGARDDNGLIVPDVDDDHSEH